MSAANACLYGIAHAVIVALGCSPGLGFVHVGHERSFVYDIADLYKAELSVPAAFESVAEGPDDVGAYVRRAMRDRMYDLSIMSRMSKDIKGLLQASDEAEVLDAVVDHVGLWDDKVGEVAAGKSYVDDESPLDGDLFGEDSDNCCCASDDDPIDGEGY